MKPTTCVRVLALFALLFWLPALAADDDLDGIDDALEDQLLERYAPVLKLHPREEKLPASVAWILPQSRIVFAHDRCDNDVLLDWGGEVSSGLLNMAHQHAARVHPGIPETCEHFGPVLYSDQHPALERRVGFSLEFAKDARPGSMQSQWTTYGHVYPRGGVSGGVVVQYWFFYAYNDFIAMVNHEGDWETIQLVLDSSLIVDRLVFSAHGDPEVLDVKSDPDLVQWQGDHPIVYTALGSHASYRAIGNLGSCEGRHGGWDRCSQTGITWETWRYAGVVNVGEKMRPRNGASWLRFSGLWGRVSQGIDLNEIQSGPEGPAYQWDTWHRDGGGEICGNEIDDDIDGLVDEECSFLPDLTMTESNPAVATDGDAGRTLVLPGERFPVRCGVENLGQSGTTSFDVQFLLSEDRTLDFNDFTLIGPLNLPGLAATSSYTPTPTWEVTVPTSVPPGTYWLIAVVDQIDFIQERDENNNIRVSSSPVVVFGPTGNQQAQQSNSTAPAAPPILDNFSDGYAELFTPGVGGWSAASEMLVGIGVGYHRDDSVAVVASDAEHYEMEFLFAISQKDPLNGPHVGAVLRFRDGFSTLRVDARRFGEYQTEMRLVEKDGSIPTTLASTVIDIDLDEASHLMVVEDTGCHVTVMLNEEVVLDTDYTSSVPIGHKGVFVNHWNAVAFDNFRLEELPRTDADDDGFSACEGDCNDNNPAIRPERSELCTNQIDDDCDGVVNEGCGSSKLDFHQSP